MNLDLMRKDNDGIWKEADYCKVLSTLSKAPIKPLPTYFILYDHCTLETLYSSKDALKTRRHQQKNYWQHQSVVFSSHEVTKEEITSIRERKKWNSGFTHNSLDYEKKDRELSMETVLWPWDEKPKPTVTKESLLKEALLCCI